MKNLLASVFALALVIAMAFALAACDATSNNQQSGDLANSDTSESPLVGTWIQREEGVHGNGMYVWSFGEDGRFAYLYSAYEPPHGGGEIESSVAERLMQGRFREDGSTVELFDVRLDDYFSWGDNWRYFPDRDPEVFADLLLATPLKKSKKTGDFSAEFVLKDATTLRLAVDRGEWPDQYDWEFELVGR